MSQVYSNFIGSDHKLILGVRYANLIKSSTRYVKKRSYKHFEESKFLEEVRNISWWDLYLETEVNEAVDLFTNKINRILDQMAPVKKFQTTRKYCPWLTKEIKDLIKQRNEAQKEMSENKTAENIEKYKNLRNKVTTNLKKGKVLWQKQKLENSSNESGKLWKNILGWLNWVSSASPNKLHHEGKIVTSPAKFAEIMNNFFVSKIEKIRQNIPAPIEEPLKTL